MNWSLRISARWLPALRALCWLGLLVEVPVPKPLPSLPPPPRRVEPWLDLNTMHDVAAHGLLFGLPLRVGVA